MCETSLVFGVSGKHDMAGLPLSSVGAKAANLARLAAAGMRVPAFSVISSAAFGLHLRDNRIAWPGPVDAVADLQGFAALRDEIRQAPVPAAVSEAAVAAYDRLSSGGGLGRVAVRSSGAEEDAASSSFAGQFDSILGVGGGGDLLDAVKECWASYLSERSLRYRASRGLPLAEAPSFAVIVQTQVFSEKAGVLFTMHPVDPELDVSYMEANFGTGESVVGGLVTPDAITFSRSDARVLATRIGTKLFMTSVSPDARGSRLTTVDDAQRSLPVLTEAEAHSVFEVGLRIEELLGGPQDIEWAFDADGLWVLQSRPLTPPRRREGRNGS